ncbi:MAG: beta-ketoacyl-ACP synthase II [Candidatus Marinimicrobia bacterium]|nr:beta-ketoacyl-ACP synthase II [Candidatus Neomarinimicrobiota bacterium]MCF7830099.1 beta-ketoacyl-ACP synthase II [Candidatus Neomarinimicrobiota bacterium]MCF7882146.1 beta-ketoacyl-ACP synthase II [Candidatus Neomarinimicrobiota bacterium]
MKRRVVVTGIGTVNPCGNDPDTFWESLMQGKSGVDKITQFDTSEFAVDFGGEVRELDVAKYLDRRETRRMDLYTIYAMVAAIQAMENSGLDPDAIDSTRAGVVVGSGIGGIHTFEEQCRTLFEKGPRRISPFFVPMMISDIAAGQISMHYHLKGPNYSVVSACATATHAIGNATKHIQYGDADIMVAGGAEATISPMAVGGFSNMKALAKWDGDPTEASRPFDAERCGFVIGEGAGILVLEEYEAAKARGAHIYAEIIGNGFTADAHHITMPAPGGEGAAQAMRQALNEAAISPDKVDYVNAHGTSTPLNDATETTAIKTVFGDHAKNGLVVSSTKSMTGHLLGAAGGIEALACIYAIQKNTIPPTINYENPDPECDLNYSPNAPTEKPVNVAMSNTFGFGGHNAVMLLAGV